MVSDYVKKNNKNSKIFVVHRLDKDTSGLVVFAKLETIKNKLQDNWDKVNREYIAIVEGKTKDKGIIKTYLEEKNNRVFSSNKGKLAITEYTKIKNNDKYTMLNINIKTGRKHQIRVHLKEMGNVIVGDKKYGCNDNSIKRMALHAYKLEFKLNNKKYKFKIDIPNSFKKLLK
jgi:23S rRNA pseudouridine1911/1915/1917 synthase